MAQITDNDIINKFRHMVQLRYVYKDLSERFDLPDVLTEEVIGEIRHYFLDSIYPEAVRRKELEAAFAGLGSYVKSPRKIWGLMGSMTKAIFKFGRQFPTALKAGMNALEAFVGAQNFESEMVEHAHDVLTGDTISDDEFEQIMARLPKRDIEKFIDDVRVLFKIMTNTVLIQRTIDILDHVVETMRRKPGLYAADEIDGILLGRSILENGYELFSKYDDRTKQLMVEYIYKNEIWYTDLVFEKWQNKA